MSERLKEPSADSMHNRPTVIVNHIVHLLERTVARKCNKTRNYRLINDHNRLNVLMTNGLNVKIIKVLWTKIITSYRISKDIYDVIKT